jgi:Carboxypeptidase regulatory-like domain/Putative zinc-finger
MSELFQSGHHPDADQLNAFVERALPAHEQQETLAHLAICPDCRSIVALSLPAVEESPELQPEPVRRPWFFGWNLAWPAVAAFAGLALFIIHIHNVATITQNNAVVPAQIAVSHPPAALPTSTPQTPSSKLAAISPPKVSNSQITEATVGDHNLATLPIHGRNFTDLRQREPASPTGAANAPEPGSIDRSATGFSMGTGLPPPPQPSAGNTLDRLQQSTPQAATFTAGSQSASAAPAAAPMTPFKQAQAAAAPAPPVVSETADVSVANQTIETTDTPSSATLSAMGGPLIVNKANGILVRHPLPGKLPAISVVSIAQQVLAIDTQNAVFLSDDDGRHWKAIPTQWQGRAVNVAVTPSGALSGRSSITETGIAHSVSSFTPNAGALSTPTWVANSSLTGTVRDATGAVIPGASIGISDATTAVVRSVKTDSTGRYLIDKLVPGNYEVEAQAPGFNKQQLAVTLAASQQGLSNLTLAIGQAAETVSVDASAMSVETAAVARKKTPGPSGAATQPVPVFEITTDTGDRWTSTDGLTWKHR